MISRYNKTSHKWLLRLTMSFSLVKAAQEPRAFTKCPAGIVCVVRYLRRPFLEGLHPSQTEHSNTMQCKSQRHTSLNTSTISSSSNSSSIRMANP